jgi:hypothetical protein
MVTESQISVVIVIVERSENYRFSSVIRCREWLICCSIVAAALSLKMDFLWFLAFFEEGLFWCLIKVKIH